MVEKKENGMSWTGADGISGYLFHFYTFFKLISGNFYC